MTVAAACGFLGLGFVLGALVTERAWWLVSRVPWGVPRPWGAFAAAYEAAWDDLMPCGQADDTDPWG